MSKDAHKMLVSKRGSYETVYNSITRYLSRKKSVSISTVIVLLSECCDYKEFLFFLCGIFYFLPFKIINMHYLCNNFLKNLLKKRTL